MREFIEYFDNGKIKTEGFLDDNDNKQGQWLSYFDNGNLHKEENYLDDELHGVFKRWHENSKLAIESNYESGKRDGIWKEYYENGSPLEEGYYENSAYVTKNFWDETGIQTLINGTGFKIEKYGTLELDVYKQYFDNYKFIKEEKISSLIVTRGFKENESDQ